MIFTLPITPTNLSLHLKLLTPSATRLEAINLQDILVSVSDAPIYVQSLIYSPEDTAVIGELDATMTTITNAPQDYLGLVGTSNDQFEAQTAVAKPMVKTNTTISGQIILAHLIKKLDSCTSQFLCKDRVNH